MARTPEQRRKDAEYQRKRRAAASPDWRDAERLKAREYHYAHKSDPDYLARTRRNAITSYNKLKATDPARLRYQQKKAQCKEDGVPFELSYEFFEGCPSNCPQCGKLFEPSGGNRNHVASVDRIDPSVGYTESNCEWICCECNRRKDNHSWKELHEFALTALGRHYGVKNGECKATLVAVNHVVASFQREDGRVVIIGLEPGEDALFEGFLGKQVTIKLTTPDGTPLGTP